MPASTNDIAPITYIRQRFFNAPRHTLLRQAFRVIPINRITREITQNSTVVPTSEQVEAKAREVIERVLENGIRNEMVEMALTKLLSNFNYLYAWGRDRDQWVRVTVLLLEKMMKVLKGMEEDGP